MLKNRIDTLKILIAEQSSLALNMLEKMRNVIQHKDKSLLMEITEQDEIKVNALETEITQFCISTLALFQPEAKFLRRIISTMQANHTLERIADITVNNAEKLPSLISLSSFPLQSEIISMLEKTSEMLSDSLLAFEEKNIDLAKKVFLKDDIVDDLRDDIFNDIILKMQHNKSIDIDNGIRIIHIAQNLERIADLSTSISKDVIYMTSGEIIEHNR